jgi:hypothetical protein
MEAEARQHSRALRSDCVAGSMCKLLQAKAIAAVLKARPLLQLRTWGLRYGRAMVVRPAVAATGRIPMVRATSTENGSGYAWAKSGPQLGHMAHKRQSPLLEGFPKCSSALKFLWLRGKDLNLRPGL